MPPPLNKKEQWVKQVRAISDKVKQGIPLNSPEIVSDLVDAGRFIESATLRLAESVRERTKETLKRYLMQEIMRPLFDQLIKTAGNLDDILTVMNQYGHTAYNFNPMEEEQKILTAVSTWETEVEQIKRILLEKKDLMDSDVQKGLCTAEHYLREHLRELKPPHLNSAVQRVLREDILKKRLAPVFEKLQS